MNESTQSQNQAPLFPFKHKMHTLADFALQRYSICIQSLTLRQGQTRHWPFILKTCHYWLNYIHFLQI